MRHDHPNVLLVTVDAMRSDFALGRAGADKPFFERLAREGTTFDTMIAAASSTTPAVASYLTGRYPPDHGILSLRDFKVGEGVATLAGEFRAAGYETSANVCGPITADTGLDAGFDTYQYRDKDTTVYTDWYESFKDRLAAASEPWFTYLHLWEAHVPRTEPPDADPAGLAYDNSIRGVDAKLAELLEIVDLDRTVVAVTGDHGESIHDGSLRNRAVVTALRQVPIPFTDLRTKHLRRRAFDAYLRPRGIDLEDFYNGLRRFNAADFPNAFHRWGHGFNVYDYLVRVPFIVAGPGVPAEAHHGTQVRQIDVFPTLLSAAGVAPPRGLESQDLLETPVDHRPAYCRAVSAFESPDDWLDGVRVDGWKFVRGRGRDLRQLFDLDADPDELSNVVDDHPEKAAELEALVDEHTARESRASRPRVSREEERRMTGRLEELGYL